MSSAGNETGTVSDAEAVVTSQPMGWLARVGLTARATIYLVMGWLAMLVAMGERANVDQRGALSEVLNRPMGTLLVILLLLGFVAYAVWRFSEAAFGIEGDKSLAARGKSLVRGLAYSVFAVSAFALLRGARESQEQAQEDLAKATLDAPGGQWILGLVGVVVIVVGLIMIVEGFTTAFLKYFDYLPPARRKAVVTLGRIGTVARGVVFVIAGVLVTLGGLSDDPSKAGGIDEVIQETLDRPFGGALVFLMGAGLLIFGIYGLAEAAWRHVPDGEVAP